MKHFKLWGLAKLGNIVAGSHAGNTVARANFVSVKQKYFCFKDVNVASATYLP